VANAFRENGKLIVDFGGFIEQGNQLFSKYKIVGGTNEHYYKEYSYEIDWANWEKEDKGRSVLITEVDVNGILLQILNLHGIWTKDKEGDERTILQCEYIVNAALRRNIATIITGDFNLLPDTKSIEILSKNFRNLISEYCITSTRPKVSEWGKRNQHVCDYIFVNDLIEVNSFETIDSNITDHFPLMLDFEIK